MSKQKTPSIHVIYIPGLGDRDNKVGLQRKLISSWQLWGVEPELFQMRWDDTEPWQPKFKRLIARIDELSKEGKQIALVGASAGASAVINAFAARKSNILGCVLIAGKVNRPEVIGKRYRKKNLAFITSAYDCPEALKSLSNKDRKRILSRYALADELVYKPDSHIPGSHNQIVPSVGHAFTILTQLIFGAPSFIKFLKSLIAV
jgi:hypothetical protein